MLVMAGDAEEPAGEFDGSLPLLEALAELGQPFRAQDNERNQEDDDDLSALHAGDGKWSPGQKAEGGDPASRHLP